MRQRQRERTSSVRLRRARTSPNLRGVGGNLVSLSRSRGSDARWRLAMPSVHHLRSMDPRPGLAVHFRPSLRRCRRSRGLGFRREKAKSMLWCTCTQRLAHLRALSTDVDVPWIETPVARLVPKRLARSFPRQIGFSNRCTAQQPSPAHVLFFSHLLM